MPSPVPFSRNNTVPSGYPAVSLQLTSLDVYVATCTPASDPTQDPTWGDFTIQPCLAVESLYFGSTLGGMSTAKLRLVPGQPLNSATQRVEAIDPLDHGDRVIIAMGGSQSLSGSTAPAEPRWAGYCVGGAINIDSDKEGITYKLVGPEWLWGEDGNSGCLMPVVGQVRLKALLDDDAADGTSDSFDNESMVVCTDDLAVFNPHGRKNMNNLQVGISAADSSITGRIFEIPDRQGNHSNGVYWNQYQAAKFLFNWYNDPNQTGITMTSADWATVGTQLDSGTPIKETNVDGLGLWAAMKAVLTPDWAMYVDPVPSALGTFDGFQVGFYQRGTGTLANFTLNPLNTTMGKAVPSVSRLSADKDTAKTVNQITVLGKATRHIQLAYYGSNTYTTNSPQVNLMLQHGWGMTEGKLSDYNAPNSVITTQYEVNSDTIASHGDTARQKWENQFVTSGPEFTQFAHVFRLFIWNEAGEWQPNNTLTGKPVYDQTNTALDWTLPNLTGIADNTGFSTPVQFPVRRRRKLLDTAYPDSTSDVDGWRRVPPTLYFSHIGITTTTQSPWYRVKRGAYRIDHERGAIWITVPDIAVWRPANDLADPDEPSLNDDRTFATLVYTGKLRMLLECSIDCDTALTAVADRQSTAGSPLIREGIFRASDRFAQSIFLAGITSPSGITPAPVDNSADAMDLAERIRIAGDRQQVHASVLAEPDWPEQAIGTIINGTQGRIINLQSGGGNDGPGAQIVGKSIHLDVMKWEYVTESHARALHGQHRKVKAKAAKAKAGPVVYAGMAGETGDSTGGIA